MLESAIIGVEMDELKDFYFELNAKKRKFESLEEFKQWLWNKRSYDFFLEDLIRRETMLWRILRRNQ
jgi:hypothetical protein